MYRLVPKERGQALTEFAIIIVVLLVLLLVIIDAGRIGWAWVTVQSAARSGARYASTGNSDCMLPPDRQTCVISTTLHTLSTLPLDEDPNAPWGDDNAYRIEVWGIDRDSNGPLLGNPGAPGKPVIVRTYYWVPILNPLLRPIGKNLKVMGQVSMINELFDSMGGASAGVGLPPPMPDLPVPKPTNTPTPSPTNTPAPVPTDTPSPTNTPSPPWCDTHFEEIPVVGATSLAVTGNLDAPPSTINIVDLSDEVSPGVPRLIGTAVLSATAELHDCFGFADVPLTSPLIADHVLKVENQVDLSWDTDFVRGAVPTNTPTPTLTPSPTASPSPTATPTNPYIELEPFCDSGSNLELTVRGYNWTDSASPVNLFWIQSGQPAKLKTILPAGHPADFTQIWYFSALNSGTHHVEARSGTIVQAEQLTFPCKDPADLVAVDLTLPNPPDQELEPFEVQVRISNLGSIDINRQFFVDVFVDPSKILTDTIPLSQSSGYQAVSALPAGASQNISVFLPGLPSSLYGDHSIWAVVDSTEKIVEPNEANNIAGPHKLRVAVDTNSATPTPFPAGSEEIAGVVHVIDSGPSFPQSRAFVWLVRVSDADVVSTTFSDVSGFYRFDSVDSGTYEVWSCVAIDNLIYSGSRSGINPPNPLVDIFMTQDPTGCPYLSMIGS